MGRHSDRVNDKLYTYTYDTLGRPSRTDVSDGSWLQYGYNVLDQSISLRYGYNGARQTVSYIGKAPRNNKNQNKQFWDIVKLIGLIQEEARRLHDEITGMGYGFNDIYEIAMDMFRTK